MPAGARIRRQDEAAGLAVGVEAASTMPSERPNFILRGARLATITVRRLTRAAGS